MSILEFFKRAIRAGQNRGLGRLEAPTDALALCATSLGVEIQFKVPIVRIPRDGGHDSMLMADSVPA